MKRKSIIISIAMAALLAVPAKAEPYTVQQGDKLHKIAAAHGVEMQDILSANPSIQDANLLVAGTVLDIPSVLPQSAGDEQSSGSADKGVGSYTVVRGDCLFDIAADYGVSVAAIIQHTPGIENPSLLRIGQVLNIPKAAGNFYRVQKGDTLAKISKSQGIDLDELLQANKGIDPNVIDVGEYILLPSKDNAAAVQPEDTEQTEDTAQQPGEDDSANPQTVQPQATQPGRTPQPSEIPLPTPTPQPITDVASDDDISSRPIVDEDEVQQLELKVFELLNDERQLKGLDDVSYDETIAALARQKSRNMADNGYLSHTSPQLGSPFKMLRDNGIKYTSASENIARGQKTAEEVVAAWMDSTGHRESMLNPNFQRIGAGFAQDEKGRSYWTILFVY